MNAMLPLGVFVKNSLLAHITFNEVLKKVVDIIKMIDGVDLLKNSPELILLVCNIIESMLGNNKFKIDKKELVISILDVIFNLSDEEKELVRNQIQFNYDNKAIKKPTYFKIIKDWILRLLS